MYQYSLKTLLKVKRFFDSHPEGIVNIPGMFPPLSLNKTDWHKWLRECINKKINRFDSRLKWRKFDSDYYYEMKRAQYQINYPRMIIDWLPKDLKTRFAHRLRCNMDF